MQKTLKNKDVYSLEAHKEAEILVEAGAEVWVESIEPIATLRVRLKPGAHLRYMSFHGGESHTIFTLDEGAQLDYYHTVVGDSSEELEVLLEGDESRVYGQTLFFGDGTSVQQMKVDHVHHGKNTRSHMVSRGAVKDKAMSRFHGNIRMLPGCNGADGKLEEHNLLLSSGSKIEAIPGLEIRHNEVQASHSTSLEKMDEEKLFYLKSRGLPEQSAMELLVEGFFWDTLERCPNLAFSQRIFNHILKCLAK